MSSTRSAGASRNARSFVVAAVVLATVAAAVLPLSSALAATPSVAKAVTHRAAVVSAVGAAARFVGVADALRLAEGHGARKVGIAATGSLSGRVTDNHGNGLSGICVDVESTGSSGSGFQESGSTGSYTVTDLEAGSYIVYFSAGCGSTSDNWVPQYWKNTDNYEDATPVTVAAGKTVSGIDAAMQPGATISGTVTSGGSPVTGICVYVEPTGETSGSISSTSDGTYTVSQLAAGSYTVEFSPCGSGLNLLPQWWKNASTESAATTVTLATGQNETGINASMKPGGIVSGTVKGSSGANLANICVDLEGVNVPSPGTFTATTASNGTYSVVGMSTGAYIAKFSPCSTDENWLAQYWKGSSTADESTVVSVTAGETTSAVSPTLQPGGTVSGTVKSTGGGRLAGICVYVTLANGGGAEFSSSTASNGTYSVTGLPGGTYVAEFIAGCGSSYNWITQYSGDAATPASAKTIVVKARSTTSNVNASLHAGGEITGTVTGHGNKLSDMCVEIFNGESEELGNAYTASNGTYSAIGLASGSYQVEFTGCGSPSSNWAPQWYRAASSQAGATSVHVTAGKTTSGINAAMAVGGTINGTVKIAGGGAVVEGCVIVHLLAPGFPTASTYTTATGSYSIPGLAPGRYVVYFYSSCGSNNALSDYYKGASTPKAATQVTIKAGKSVVADASLAKGGEVSGTVTGPGKKALADVCVDLYATSDLSELAYSTETADNGTYLVMGLPTGRYVEEFLDCSEYPLYAAQWYRGRGTEATASRIAVTAGKTVTGVDAQLSGGGTITGTVKRPGGKGEPEVCVDAVSVNNSDGGGYTTTTGSGSYTLYGLEPGKYDIEFDPGCIGSTFGTVWYKSGLYQSKSTPVTVSSGHTTSGVNADLAQAGEISGTVKVGSKPVVYGCVEAYFAHTNIDANGTDSYADGTYVIKGLSPGAYDVEFEPFCADIGNVAPQWWKKATNEAKATTVTVRSGKDTTGIDAALTTGGQIAGTVKSSAGSVLAGVAVQAIPRGSTGVVYYAYANIHGDYTLTGLPAGSYIVVFDPSLICGGSGSIYAQQYWKHTASASAAKAVGVSVGKTTSGIDGSLVLISTPSSYTPDC